MNSHGSRLMNGLLQTLDAEASARLGKRLKPVDLNVHDVLYKPGQSIREVYFPEDAVIVLLGIDSKGNTVETGTVGREGASWISASVSAPSMPCETTVAIQGRAHTLAIEHLDEELQQNPSFQSVLTQYSHAVLVASMRTTACVAMHGVSERCARWMLHTLDRTTANRFAVTHEFLAALMGTTRPTMTVTIGAFERAGIVSMERGAITVIHRSRLEAACCECYGIIREHYREVGRL